MKVENNVTIYVGAKSEGPVSSQSSQEQTDRKTIFAGNLNAGDTMQERIEARRAEAKDKARKLVADVLDGERALDKEVEGHREQIQKLTEERELLTESDENLSMREADLQTAFENGEIGQEDYDQQAHDLSQERKELNRFQQEAESQIVAEGRMIESISRERLKTAPMVKANIEAEKVMESASGEIKGMIADSAMEKLDEDAKLREEKAEKLEEQREEAEALIERQKEKRDEQEELLEDMPMRDMISLDKMQSDVKTEVQDMLNKMKLVTEDIKGIAVDETL